MKPSADAVARYSPWIAVGAALLYFLHEQLEVGGSLLLYALRAPKVCISVLTRFNTCQSP